MAQLAAGPVFLALLGSVGTGKTWLLQAVLTALREQGRPVVFVPRGELLIAAAAGTVVLVDEAARMDDGMLAQLAGARDACVVLADLPAFASRLGQLAHPPAIVPLAPFPSRDMPGFARSWLAARGLPAEVLDERAVRRLFDHSGGVPRLVVQFLRAALALNRQVGATVIGADQVDEVMSLRLGDPVAEPAAGAEGTPGDVGWDLAVAGPAAPDPAPAAAPVLPEAAPIAIAPDAPARPWARLARAGLAAVLALAVFLLIAAVLAASQVRPPSRASSRSAAAPQAGPANAGPTSNRKGRTAGGTPDALPPSVVGPLAETPAAPAQGVAEVLAGTRHQAAIATEGEPIAAAPPARTAASEPVPDQSASALSAEPVQAGP